MKMLPRFTIAIVTAAVAAALLPEPANAGTPPRATSPLNIPIVNAVVGAVDINQALTVVDDTITALEQVAVDEYLNTAIDEAGEALGIQDLEVGTLNIGDYVMTVVSPDFGVRVNSISLNTGGGADGAAFRMGAGITEVGSEPSTSGPTMGGTWPSWTTSWHASVRLKLYMKKDYLGDGLFQSSKRKMQNDGSGAVDYWQVSRRAAGRPQNWDSGGWFDGNPMAVKKLWASQDVTEATSAKTKEWMLNLTNPDEGFSNCRDGVSFTAGPFTFTPPDCDEYDVWTGRIGHQRMYMDQGSYLHNGQRALAYVSGFSIQNAYTPYFTWYEFVTLAFGNGSNVLKCNDESVGVQNSTETVTCTWTPAT